jgi:hypothetical protein
VKRYKRDFEFDPETPWELLTHWRGEMKFLVWSMSKISGILKSPLEDTDRLWLRPYDPEMEVRLRKTVDICLPLFEILCDRARLLHKSTTERIVIDLNDRPPTQ